MVAAPPALIDTLLAKRAALPLATIPVTGVHWLSDTDMSDARAMCRAGPVMDRRAPEKLVWAWTVKGATEDCTASLTVSSLRNLRTTCSDTGGIPLLAHTCIPAALTISLFRARNAHTVLSAFNATCGACEKRRERERKRWNKREEG